MPIRSLSRRTAALLLATSTVGAAAADDCRFGAFVQEDDPAGLNVRATPSPSGRVLGTLPRSVRPADNPDFIVRIELDVLGQDGGWFHVRHARDNPALTSRPARPVFSGDGWVSGRKLTVKSQATRGHASPDAASPTVLALRDGGGLDNDAFVAVTHLLGCHGKWALIELDASRLPADLRSNLKLSPGGPPGATPAHPRAWVDRLCSVQETSCDGQ